MKQFPVFRDSFVKKKKHHYFLILFAFLLVLVILAQTEIFVFYQGIFGRRFSTSDELGLMTLEDYPKLSKTDDHFKSNKGQTLRGGFFSSKDVANYKNSKNYNYKGIVVLSHGFGGGGYAWYLPQINYLCESGYLVFAFDKTGADSSDGKDVRGLPQGIIDLSYALSYVKKSEYAKKLPILLYGHSWGGYSSCAILQDEKDVIAVCSISGFNTSNDMLLEQGTALVGNFVSYIQPSLYICDKMRFGKYADYSSLKGLRETNCDVIIFHSDDDPTISIEKSFLLYQKELSDKKNITFMPITGKKHDVYFSDDATKYRVESRRILARIANEPPQDQLDSKFVFYMNFDKRAANAVDENIMQTIVDFFDKSVVKYKLSQKNLS